MHKKIHSLLRKFGFHIETDSKKAFDLVCGMELGAGQVTHAVAYNGEPYYFCSVSCKRHFEGDPKKYIG